MVEIGGASLPPSATLSEYPKSAAHKDNAPVPSLSPPRKAATRKMGSVAALPFLSLARSLGSISLVCKLLRTNGTGFYEPEMENWVGHKATAAAATALLSPWSAVGLGAAIIYGQGVQIFESFRGTTTERRGTVEHLRSAIRARDARERARTPFHFARIIPPLHIKEERDHARLLGGRRAKQGQNENEPLPSLLRHYPSHSP